MTTNEQIENIIDEDQNENKKINIEDITLLEYLNIVQKEYEYERSKKQSFESRAGFIITIVGGSLIFIIEKVSIKALFMTQALSLKGLCALFIYSCFVYIFAQLYEVIKVEKHETFDVTTIDTKLMEEDRVNGTASIVLTYIDVISNHRILNDKRAKAFNKALMGLPVSLILVALYMNLG